MSRKILLADDSLTIQKVVELTFMEGDFEVTAVSNGDDAMARLAEERPDVVIADVHMPGADGFAIARASKERYPDTPVLLLVGTFEPFDESAAEDSGADAHLKKPFDSQELLRLVEELVSAEQEDVDTEAGESAASDSFAELAYADADVDSVEVAFDVDESFEMDEAVVVQPPDDMGAEETAPAVSGQALEVEEDSAMSAPVALSDEDIERIARRVVELIGEKTVREVSWDVIPDLAEIVIKDRIRELESQVD